MRATLVVAHSDLRQRWRSWLALSLLVAIAGGAVMLAFAGARRTDTAYERFLQASTASDILVSPMGSGFPGYYPALAQLPGVVAEGGCRADGVSRRPAWSTGGLRPSTGVHLAADDNYGRTLDRPKLLSGRMARPERPDKIVID